MSGFCWILNWSCNCPASMCQHVPVRASRPERPLRVASRPEPMKQRTARSPVRIFCPRCAVLGSSQVTHVTLLSGCADTALSVCDTSSAGQPACLASNLHIWRRLPWHVMQRHSGRQVRQRPPTTSFRFALHAGLHALMGIIEPSVGCTHRACCRVDTGLLWPPVGPHFGLPGCVPQGLALELVCCISCMHPVNRPLALPASRCQETNVVTVQGCCLRTCI